MAVKASPLPGYVALSPQVLFQQAKPLENSRTNDPSLIVLYGWGDAVPKHIAKYTEHYAELYPASSLAIVLCPMSSTVFANLKSRTERMKPVAKLVHEYSKVGEDSILVHVMSGAGTVNYASTLNTYVSLYGTTMPHKVLVLDSSPGTAGMTPGNIRRWSRAMAIGTGGRLPWPLVVTQLLWAMFIALHALYEMAINRQNSGAWSHGAINNDGYVHKNTRLYLYSKEDPLMSWEGIVAHANEAKDAGWRINMEVFSDTGHVSHMRKRPKQYWGAVQRVWSQG